MLAAVAALSCAVVAPSYAMEQQPSMSMYGSVGVAGKFFTTPEFTLGSEALKIQGVDSKDVYGDLYKPEYKIGYAGSIAVGMPMSSVRIEAEGNYFKATVDDSTNKNAEKVRIGTKAGITSDNVTLKNDGFTHIAGLLNVYYDAIGMFDAMDNSIVPYVGVGAGMARVTFNEIATNALAYQAKAGVSVSLSNEMRVYAGYKYFGVKDLEFVEVKTTAGAGTVAEAETVTIKTPYSMHGPEVGVMMTFSF